jgi:hypothetical protein
MFRRSAKATLARLNAEAAANKRLDAVTGRGKVEESLYPSVQELPLKPPPVIKRRFWTPAELIVTQQ